MSVKWLKSEIALPLAIPKVSWESLPALAFLSVTLSIVYSVSVPSFGSVTVSSSWLKIPRKPLHPSRDPSGWQPSLKLRKSFGVSVAVHTVVCA